MQAKLNPQGTAKINFPGFQEILDFTSAGGESSVSLTVDSDTDKEYFIYCRNPNNQIINIRMNSDSASVYGYQYIDNSGSVTAGRGARTVFGEVDAIGYTTMSLLTPTGFLKTANETRIGHTSGTTIANFTLMGLVYNSTSNITSIDFISASGNFASGTRITVYARRSN